MHHAHDGGDDAKCRQGIGRFGHRVDRDFTFHVMCLYLVVHQILDLKGVQTAADHETQVIGQEFKHMVVGDNLRVLGKKRTLVGCIDIGLDRHQPLLAYLREDVVQ